MEEDKKLPIDEYTQKVKLLGGMVDILKIYNETYPISLDEMNISSSGKFYKRINTNEENYFKAHRGRYSIEFKNPTFVDEVSFELEGGNLNDTVITYHTVHEGERTITISNGNKKLTPKCILEKIDFNIDYNTFQRPKIKKIDILGYENTDFEEISRHINEYIKFQHDVGEIYDALEHEHQEHIQKVVLLKEEIEVFEKEADAVTEKYMTIDGSFKELTGKYAELKTKKSDITNEIKTLETEKTEKTTELGELVSQVKTEQNNLHQITEDKDFIDQVMTAYVKQSNSDSRWYLLIALIPLIIIAYTTFLLVNGTYNLTTVYNQDPALNFAISKHTQHNGEVLPSSKLKDDLNDSVITDTEAQKRDVSISDNIDISSIFWTRIPFVVIMLSLLVLCYKIIYFMAEKIIFIHNQRRAFTKLFILAKEVVDKSVEGEDLDIYERIDLRTKLKMNLLREYIKGSINLDYNHKLEPTLWMKIASKLNHKLQSLLNKEDLLEVKDANI